MTATPEQPVGDSSAHEVSLTQLRKNIYNLVDEVIASGNPLILNRQGCQLKLSVVSKGSSKLGNLKKRNTIIGSGDDLESESIQNWEHDNGFD